MLNKSKDMNQLTGPLAKTNTTEDKLTAITAAFSYVPQLNDYS